MTTPTRNPITPGWPPNITGDVAIQRPVEQHRESVAHRIAYYYPEDLDGKPSLWHGKGLAARPRCLTSAEAVGSDWAEMSLGWAVQRYDVTPCQDCFPDSVVENPW